MQEERIPSTGARMFVSSRSMTAGREGLPVHLGGVAAVEVPEAPLPPQLDPAQGTLALHLAATEQDISARFIVDLVAFYRSQLERLPEWHPLHHELGQQVRVLAGRHQLRPTPLP